MVVEFAEKMIEKQAAFFVEELSSDYEKVKLARIERSSVGIMGNVSVSSDRTHVLLSFPIETT